MTSLDRFHADWPRCCCTGSLAARCRYHQETCCSDYSRHAVGGEHLGAQGKSRLDSAHRLEHTLRNFGLQNLYDYLIPVDRVSNPAPANLYLMGRPDLLFAFTKIALWRQTQFRKIVYLDADVVVLRAPDELFDLKAPFAAAPDVGWPDAFNSGVMVLNPDMGDYWALHTLASSGDSFDGADQGLLNQYFENKNWHRLSFTYNCTPNAQYQWEPAYRYYKSRISMVHFIGKDKPWLRERGSVGASTYNELLSRWWAVFDKHMRKPVSFSETCLAPRMHPNCCSSALGTRSRPSSPAAAPASDTLGTKRCPPASTWRIYSCYS